MVQRMSESWRFVTSRLAESYALAIVIGLMLVVASSRHSRVQHGLRVVWRLLTVLARRPQQAALVAALVTFLVTAATQQLAPSPPEVHDEFANLLLADTLLNGRLANPTHPMSAHFETFHVLQSPSYAAKYPPAMGVALAAGKLLLGAAPLGVCLLHAMAGAAIVWMLQGWTSRRWAFIGGLMFALLPTIQTEWSRSFMGSGAAILGACFVLGAVPRIAAKRNVLDAVLLALGLIALANSRPFEGLVIAVPSLLWLGVLLIRSSKHSWWTTFQRTIAPATVVLVGGALMMGAYCHAVTGSWVRLPYSEHHSQYAISPAFLWQSLDVSPDGLERRHPNPQFKDFYEKFELRFYLQQQAFSTFAKFKALSLAASLLQLINPTLFWALLSSLPFLCQRRFGLPWVLLFVSVVGSVGVVWLQAPYIAPMVAPLFVLMTNGMRRLSVWRREHRQGRAIVSALAGVHFAVLLVTIGLASTAPPSDWAVRREKMQAAFERSGDKHLVIVAYSAQHNPHIEWVYNRADIDSSPVVWARYLDDASNQELFRYYRDRQKWILMADKRPVELIPLKQTPQPAATNVVWQPANSPN